MCRTKNGPLRKSSIKWIFLWRFPIQNHPKLPITEKRKNKTKYLNWNSIRLKVVRKTSMSNSVKSLGYIKRYCSSSPRTVKSPSISIRHNCQKICNWSRRPKTILEIRKKTTFLKVISNPIIYKFFQDFTNHRKKTNRAVVFSSRPFRNIPKHRDHCWDLPTIWKKRLFQTNIEESSQCVWRFRLTVL